MARWRVDAARAALGDKILVKAGAAVGAENVHQRTLALDAPQHAVELVIAEPVVDDRAPPRAVVRVEQRRTAGNFAPVVAVKELVKARLPDVANARAGSFAVVGVRLDAALFCQRNDIGQRVEALRQRVGRQKVTVRCRAVIDRVRVPERAALKIIRFLRAMIGEAIERAPGVTTAPRQRRDEQRIDAGGFLQRIEHLLDTLVHKRDRADLNTYECLGHTLLIR